MVDTTKGTEKSESPAVRLVRLAYIESIGTLLGIMIDGYFSPKINREGFSCCL